MDDRFAMGSPESQPPAVDPDVLESLLSLGDDALRAALGEQLTADFTRLRAALQGGEPAVVGRATHELKGLAATVGANRLAEMAASVDAVAPGFAPSTLAVLVMPLVAEIDAVLAILGRPAGDDPGC